MTTWPPSTRHSVSRTLWFRFPALQILISAMCAAKLADAKDPSTEKKAFESLIDAVKGGSKVKQLAAQYIPRYRLVHRFSLVGLI